MKKKKVRLEDLILEILERYPESWVEEGTLMGAFKLPRKKGFQRFQNALEKLASKNQIVRKNGSVKRNTSGKSPGTVEGIYSETRHGSGYVKVEGLERDIRIPSKHTHTALDKDRVRVAVQNKSRSDRTEGKVVEVLERGKSFFVGTFQKESKNTYLIIPDEKSASTEFFVHPDNTNGAKHNDKVTFRLVDWLHPRSLPEAEVLEVLGKKGTNNAAILSILAENELKAAFPRAVEEQAESVATEIPAKEYRRRKDIREMEVFTIDPADAKDFDDALSIQILDNGNFYLGVHIADVSYYVQQGTALDDEAKDRGTSVYLVDRVIPMLPESLSNGVCSLRPNEDKLSHSCFMEVAPDGNVVNYEIEETVINSSQRFVYEEVQEIIDGKEHKHAESVRILAKMTSMLTDKRFREGSIDLDTPEPRFRLDDAGKPLGVFVKDRLQAHRLVEECMLLANKTVSRHISKLREQNKSRRKQNETSGKSDTYGKQNYPFLYRVHDRPDPEKLKNIAENVRPLGIEFPVKDGKISASKINSLIRDANETKLKYAINELILRSMAKAVYSPKNIGHYGLGFKEYTHFTSPIRRYPDLIVHRLLKQYEAGVPAYSFNELIALGDHCSEKERDAVTAERDSIKLKQVEYMSAHIGETFDGVISGVSDKGLFVILNESYCEGMIAIRDLDDDYYVYDQSLHQLRGRSRGNVFRLGDDITVTVARTDIDQRQIDFLPERKKTDQKKS
ncbi:ribonuclease R [Natronogracilivirga saccharolytica]|uniref:Ribonuclease R n=1 Tax=Natronogracilivirga saccharolytica TaxID=2812953 RepID=A0A8J7RMB2_9BACT|nr:ribonuclease R [Natronogracilivirga saccharolytica]MBP3192349.1 ribonuclease R [Natronogracilivirga saccharolytica]